LKKTNNKAGNREGRYIMTVQDWNAKGERLYGKNKANWKFKCPSCGYVASAQEWKDAGDDGSQTAFSCIGRLLGSEKTIGDKTGGPCNYAGGGLFRLNPVEITNDDGQTSWFFDFADNE